MTDEKLLLGSVLPKFRSSAALTDDDLIDRDVVLVWTEQPRIITGADILGRLMRGISTEPPGSRAS